MTPRSSTRQRPHLGGDSAGGFSRNAFSVHLQCTCNGACINCETWKAPAHRELTMSKFIRKWFRTRRYHTTVRRLNSLSPDELREMGIAPWDIDHLARKAAGVTS